MMTNNENDSGIRLQKYLSEQGIMSRRAAEKAMQDGRIKVNGRRAALGTKVDPEKDLIEINGVPVEPADKPRYVYIMLNKPTGVVTTLSDELGRKCVADYVADAPERVWPVGRLDYESEGLLILTNDGELTNILTHPSHEIPKIYRVTLKGSIPQDKLGELRRPMLIDGYRLRPVEVKLVADKGTSTVIEMTLREGRNRQIRKMCDACGFDVRKLQRVAIGSLRLGDLTRGNWRELTKDEVEYLKSGGSVDKISTATRTGERKKQQNYERYDSPTRTHRSRYSDSNSKH